MSPLDQVVIVVNGEGGRFPSGYRGVAVGAGVGNIDSRMIRIGGGVIAVEMASLTGIRSVGVVAVMTVGTAHAGMRSGQGVVVAVDGKCCRFPSGVGCMAIGAGLREIKAAVIRIDRGIVVCKVACHTFFWCSAKAGHMTLQAGGCKMSSSEGKS